MKFYQRKSVRLKDYDYSQQGCYFITVCTHNRKCLFGDISGDQVILNDIGRVVEECWHNIPKYFLHVELDDFVIMPNHVHGIIKIVDRGTACRALTLEKFGKPVPGSIPTIIRSYKSAVTKWARKNTNIDIIWQRNYHEHVIRDGKGLNYAREYIKNNPLQWTKDDYYNGLGIDA